VRRLTSLDRLLHVLEGFEVRRGELEEQRLLRPEEPVSEPLHHLLVIW